MLHDASGDCNSISAFDYAEDVGTQYDTIAKSKQLAYMKVVVGQKIEDLRIEYSRTYVYDSSENSQHNAVYNQGLNIQLFGEVRKALAFQKDGTYAVSYV